MIIDKIQDFEADFLWKVSLIILNSGIILKALTHFLWSVIVAFPGYTCILFECPRHVDGNFL